MLNLLYKNQLGLYREINFFFVKIIRNTNRLCGHCVVKVFPPHAMKAYRVSAGLLPLILNLNTRRSLPVNFTPLPLYPWERTPAPIE